MNDFQFISANETYRNLYYQLPKVLFTSEFYKNMWFCCKVLNKE